MKKIILSLALLTTSIFAGPYCINTNEKFIQCNCSCNTIKGRHCTECTHLQNARPITIVDPTEKQIHKAKTKTYIPESPENALEKLAAQYVKNKYDV
jgi:hypothetical protein